MKKLYCFFVILNFCFYTLMAQKHDNNRIKAIKYKNTPNVYGNILNFNTSPPIISEQILNYQIRAYNTTMSDLDGNLIFYSNGIKIINAEHELMENGDSLNWGEYTDNHLDGFNNASGLIISLPFPDSDFLYHIIHSKFEWGGGPLNYNISDWLYTTIDISKNDGLGKVIAKDQLIGSGHIITDVNACRHGNGRDWWVLAAEDSASMYYRSLITPQGVLGFISQNIGSKPPWPSIPDFGGQNLFSPNGKKYVDFDSRNGIRIFDFDRCTGLLSNFKLVTFPQQLSWGLGAAISPNSKFLYISTATEIIQFSLNAPDIIASIDTVAVYEEFFPPFPNQEPYFERMQLMIDGKIYIIPIGDTEFIHYIANPDGKGDECNVVQLGVQTPNFYRTCIPTFPNYRLYDLPGSPCDTLGINDPTPVMEQEWEWPAQELVIYPNPVSELLFLNTVAATSQPVEVIIHDMSGREVLRRAHPASVRSYGLRLPELAAGMYVVSVRLRDGRVLAEKLVKE